MARNSKRSSKSDPLAEIAKDRNMKETTVEPLGANPKHQESIQKKLEETPVERKEAASVENIGQGEDQAIINAKKAFARYGMTKEKREIKNQHISIFLTPSLYKTFKTVCENGQMSMNSTVTMLIENFVEEALNPQD